MNYQTWRNAYIGVVGGNQTKLAHLSNLDREDRIPRVADFKNGIAARWTAAGAHEDPSADTALQDGVEELKPLASGWLGLLPVAGVATTRIPRRTYTHVSSEHVARFRSRTPIDPDRPPATADLAPLNWRRLPNGDLELASRFIWVSWPPVAGPLPRDPTRLKQELGLDHYATGQCVYRCRVDVNAANETCYIPTCLDARLYEAWARPPDGHTEPWGLTRDLCTGEPRWPEVLVEAAPRRDLRPTGYLVRPTRHASAKIGPVVSDFMIGR